MSTQPQGLRTPQRATYNSSSIFDDQNPCNNNQFTPCTRLSRMTIESQSNGINARIRNAHIQYPVTNFNDKLMEAVREEQQEQESNNNNTTTTSTHPNLDMFLGADRISMFDKSKQDQFFSSYSEDEESDEGDLFSSSLCPMSSPERILTRQSIFDDEPMNSPPQISMMTKRSIFDDDEEDGNEEEHHHYKHIDMEDDDEDDEQDYYDPSNAWLSQLYYDDSTSSNSNNSNESFEEEEQEDGDEEENRPPRMWINRQTMQEKKMRRTLPHEEDNTAFNNERLPLREIRFEDYYLSEDDSDLPAKKKMMIGSNGKPHKMRFMRTLSPPRYAKRKGKEAIVAENTLYSSSAALL